MVAAWAFPFVISASIAGVAGALPVVRWFDELAGGPLDNATDPGDGPSVEAGGSGSGSGDTSGKIPPYAMVMFGMGVSLMAIACVQVMKRREDTKRAKVAQGMKAALAHQMPSGQVDRDKQAYLSLVDVDGPLSHRTQMRELRSMRDNPADEAVDASSKGDEREAGSEQDEIFDKVLALFHTASGESDSPDRQQPPPPRQSARQKRPAVDNTLVGALDALSGPDMRTSTSPNATSPSVGFPNPATPVGFAYPTSPASLRSASDGVDSRRIIAGMQRSAAASSAGSPAFNPKAIPAALARKRPDNVLAAPPAVNGASEIPLNYEFPASRPQDAYYNHFDRLPSPKSSIAGRTRGVLDV
ncbi:hypothetical protein DIPPA_04365 [Diplonema papillatum]|nr:hypothetical protein DIPPA_04365 [Diplonema papillatum]